MRWQFWRSAQVWQKYLAGELDEEQATLNHEEVEALFGTARTPEERRLIQKVLRLIQGA
jgi:CBS domain containing-hemolysin-like protein